VDEDALFGDLAGALYALAGGDASAKEEAVTFFAENGLADPSVTAQTPLTGTQAEALLKAFSEMAQIPYEAAEDVKETALSRGELAQILQAYVEPLM